MIYWLAAIAQFLHIFLKAFQQRNVVFDHHAWIMPTSVLMGLFEVAVMVSVYKAIVEGNVWVVGAAIGFGGGFGALAAMWTHKRIVR